MEGILYICDADSNPQALNLWSNTDDRKLNLNYCNLESPKLSKSDFDNLGEESELAMIGHLLDFPDVVADSARTYLISNLALYLYELANLANRFYEAVPVIKDENLSRRAARLALVETAAAILKTGLGLLGIRVLEKI